MDARWLSLLLSLLMLAGNGMLNTQEEIPRLINRDHRLSRDEVPYVLALPQVEPSRAEKLKEIYLLPEAAEALEALFEEAARAGYTLYAVSGYRSYALQASLYRAKVSAVGERRAGLLVAQPGTSEHQTGLAMDINGRTTLSQGLVEAFGHSPEGIWVANQAHRFGFIIRYPLEKTDVTGYSWEPWHLRYVGVGHATAIYVMDVTLEEYVALLQLRAWAQTWPVPLRWVLGMDTGP